MKPLPPAAELALEYCDAYKGDAMTKPMSDSGGLVNGLKSLSGLRILTPEQSDFLYDAAVEIERLRGVAQTPLTWLAEHKNYELSFNGWDDDPAWQVHSVSGGRNDTEWTLRATGRTPDEALRKAMAADRGGAA